jgi:hypothetical protein
VHFGPGPKWSRQGQNDSEVVMRPVAFLVGALALNAASRRPLRHEPVAARKRSPVVLPPVKVPASATGASAVGALAAGQIAFGAFAVGALAVGAMAIGALAIGRLEIRKARLREVEIEPHGA